LLGGLLDLQSDGPVAPLIHRLLTQVGRRTIH
jgi:hypothetical protein